MQINNFGQVTISEEEAIEAIYAKKILSLDNVYINNPKIVGQFNNSRRINADSFLNLEILKESDLSIEEFDRLNQQTWFMPQEYQKFDIETWLVEHCDTDKTLARVQLELELFRQHNMLDLLKYLKYLVDTMRTNNIVWGVGRGSSVASYVLYLIGVHKIDSIKYELDIREFLK